jgi:mono/diheme cytochrome c family protein
MIRLSTLTLLFASSLAFAADDPKAAARLETYNKDIKPFIDKSCVDCHNATKAKGGFNASTIAGLEKGGKDEGDGIIWGNADKSSLYHFAYLGSTARGEHLAMPPKKDKKHDPLTTDQLAKLKAWIEAK